MSSHGIFCRLGRFVKIGWHSGLSAIHRWSRRPSRGGSMCVGVFLGLAVGVTCFPRYVPVVVKSIAASGPTPLKRDGKSCATCEAKRKAAAARLAELNQVGPTALVPVPEAQ